MKPTHSILDNSFRYVPAMATSVADTWSRFGWRPTSEQERRRRLAQSGRTGRSDPQALASLLPPGAAPAPKFGARAAQAS